MNLATFLFGKKKRSKRRSIKSKKPNITLIRKCIRLKIKVTRKIGKRRVYKSTKLLKKLLAKKLKKLKTRKRKPRFGASAIDQGFPPYEKTSIQKVKDDLLTPITQIIFLNKNVKSDDEKNDEVVNIINKFKKKYKNQLGNIERDVGDISSTILNISAYNPYNIINNEKKKLQSNEDFYTPELLINKIYGSTSLASILNIADYMTRNSSISGNISNYITRKGRLHFN